jgi:alcohol/geraniol dehydrogenase (NADP+)
MVMIKAYAAQEAKGKLKPFEYEAGKLNDEYVEIDVQYCGICHSDLSCLEDEWGITTYPFVPGHEVVGKVSAIGSHVPNLKVGQTVGLGWYTKSCLTCIQCLTGNHNLCPTAEFTMIGRYGGYANKVRAHYIWATPLPEGVDIKSAGPLFCGGVTVFNPIIQNNVQPTQRVGVIGIGGLGHMALGFLNAWGCDVTAFSTSPDKENEAKSLGAHHFINSKDLASMTKYKGYFDLILNTTNVNLDWNLYLTLLRPKGKLHIVGIGSEINAAIFPMISSQLSFGASPLGSPATTQTMLEFVARHNIKPVVEEYPMSKVNEAMDRLKSGKARYRIVLKNDF